MDNFYTAHPAEEFERKFGDGETNSASENLSQTAVHKLHGLSWGDLSKREFTNTEKIIFGLVRGNVGTMFAVTNLGKTTFTLNLALTLAAGRTFHPFVKNNPIWGRRVLIVDGESTQPELKADLDVMMRNWSLAERELVKQNLFIVCDEELGDEPLDLAKSEHIEALGEVALTFKPDLIIIDTMSALFTLRNESDNAEIKRAVMQPLKKLGKDANAVVWLLHHIGKQNEDGRAIVGAYLGRGGSNIGGLSRVVTALKQDVKDRESIIFSLEKAKGYHLEPVRMTLDRDARWFVPSNEVVMPEPTNYQLIISTVRNFGRMAKRKEVVEALAGKMSDSTITRNLSEAVTRGDLVSPKVGYYGLPDVQTTAYEEASNVM